MSITPLDGFVEQGLPRVVTVTGVGMVTDQGLRDALLAGTERQIQGQITLTVHLVQLYT